MKPRKLTSAQVLSICAEYEAGASMQQLADKHGIHYENVRQVIRCETYKDIRRPIIQVRRPGTYVRRAA